MPLPAVVAAVAGTGSGSSGSGGGGGGGSGGGASPCSSAAGTSTLRQHRGFACVWVRGALHGLGPTSGAARVSICELELDCLAEDVLNVREVRHTPLRVADGEERLVQSLAQLWRDERQRQRAAGQPPPPPLNTAQGAAPGMRALPQDPAMAELQRRVQELTRRPLPEAASQSHSSAGPGAGLGAPTGAAEEARGEGGEGGEGWGAGWGEGAGGESQEGLSQLLLAAAANSHSGGSHTPAEAGLSEHPAAEEGVISSGASVEELLRQLREAQVEAEDEEDVRAYTSGGAAPSSQLSGSQQLSSSQQPGSQQLSSQQGESQHGGSLSQNLVALPPHLSQYGGSQQRERGSPQGGSPFASQLASQAVCRAGFRPLLRQPSEQPRASQFACSQHCALDDLDDLDAEMGGCEMRCEIELHGRGRRATRRRPAGRRPAGQQHCGGAAAAAAATAVSAAQPP